MSWQQERKSGLQLAVGLAIMLGSLQCLGVLLFWVIVGQGSAVLAAGVGGLFLSSILSSFFFSLSPGTRLDLTTNKQLDGGTNKLSNSLKALVFLLKIIHALK